MRFRDYLYALSQHFAVKNLTAMFLLESLAQPGNKSLTGRDISYICDDTLLLQVQLGAELCRTIRVLKSRASAHDGGERKFRITPSGVVVE